MAILVYVTCPSTEVATSLAKMAVSSKLAACGNIIPGLTSIYEWEGSIQQERECLLLIKTQKGKFSQLSEELSKNHPYDCPAIVSISLDDGVPEFLKWVQDQTT